MGPLDAISVADQIGDWQTLDEKNNEQLNNCVDCPHHEQCLVIVIDRPQKLVLVTMAE